MTLDPTLAAAQQRLPDTLAAVRPHTLVVGANPVNAEAIGRWVHAMSAAGDTRRLRIVRRGTSLASIDLEAAAAAGVDVVNTPGVNARYVAAFVTRRLLADVPAAETPAHTAQVRRAPVVGLLGAGNINGGVAEAAAARGCHIVVFSPSLASSAEARRTWLHTLRLPPDAVTVAAGLDEVFATAELLGIAVPLVGGGHHPTRGFVDAHQIERFTGRRIVSVSEPHVFTNAALLAAYADPDLEVVLDNAPYMIAPVRHLVTHTTRTAHNSGDPDGTATREAGLRAGFTLSSEAMLHPDCGPDLDEAFLAVLATADISEKATPRQSLPRRRGTDSDVVVVGGGIVGLTVAFGLLAGGWERLRVLDAAPADRGNLAAQGTTFAGTNGRHLSATETVPHASPARAGALTRATEYGGWRLGNPATLSAAERHWVATFEQRTDRPHLHTSSTNLAIALNRLGLCGWEALVDAYPDLLAGIRWDARPTRAYLSAADLESGRKLQGKVNTQVRELDGNEISASWPALRRDGDAVLDGPRIRGLLEVDGYAVNIHDLAEALRRHLVDSGVEVRARARVGRITQTDHGIRLLLTDGKPVMADTAVLTTGGADLAALLGDTWPAARCVQGVLGVSVTAPNPGIHRPLKIHAPDPLGIVNITTSPGGVFVHASGGFGFVGLTRPTDLGAGADLGAPTSAARPLLRLLEDILVRLFPALRRRDGAIDAVDRRICVRPMTPDGVPVVEALDAFGGRVIVAAGTNAGGTVEAPALATLVGQLLDNRAGAAHLALHGSRPSLGIPTPVPAG
jgi:glycine/D-amino acid oxidase-like deaminating enzyme/phosphoglycerate dehydrogenase-like enzyme